jgi:excisionase family DNA binding protein
VTPATEARVREAALRFADELLAALAADEPAEPSPDDLLNAAKACQRLGGIARSTLYALTLAGTLRSVKVGRRRMWPASYLAEYLASQR